MTASQTPGTDRIANPKRILCPIDMSEYSQPALACAVSLGRTYGAQVTALHVFAAWLPPASLSTFPGWMMQVPEARESIENELRALLEPLAGSGAAPQLRIAEGDAAAEIVRCAAELDSDLIVIGTHGRSGFDRFTLGSVTEKVLRKAPCPVLTLPPGGGRAPTELAFRNILCPVDFSAYSERALDFAVSLASRLDGTVTVVHVVEALDEEQHVEGADGAARPGEQQRRAVQSALRDLIAGHAAGARVTEVVAAGTPHREIVRLAAAQASDLIVIGVRGRGTVDITLFGSTANQVVRRASCPVVTIRSALDASTSQDSPSVT